MKILIITQYFPPETGAPQNRLFSLAVHLTKHREDVSILTAMPNYPKMEIFHQYKGKLYLKEKSGALTIYRSYIYVNKKNTGIYRLLSYASFVISSILVGWRKIDKQDFIICESPPLFLGFTALFLKWNKRARLVFNVSDLWPESVEKLGIIRNKALLKMGYRLEKKIYMNSTLVSGQTLGIIENIKARYPCIKTYWLPNGIDYDQFDTNCDRKDFRNIWKIRNTDFVLLYAGILGYAQGLETIIEAAYILRDKPNIKFILVGDGPEKSRLIEIAQSRKTGNVIFIGNRPRNEMPEIIAACDAFIVPLKRLDLFLGAIPSKIFEPLAMGKPIILGVDGEARELFIEKGNCGLYYEPENPSDLVRCALMLAQDEKLRQQLGENGRRYVKTNFNRAAIAYDFYNQLIQLNKQS